MTERVAVVLLSGGQDSTTCLAWAKVQGFRPVALSFDYGQRHRVELDAARAVASAAGVEHIVLPIAFPAVSAMNSTTIPVAAQGGMHGLPTTFLPGRNAAFLAMASSLAVARGGVDVVTGVCQTDYSGYPDCREEFVWSIELTMRLALAAPGLRIHAPLMHLTKADTVRLARDLGAMHLLAHSHTCYEGARPPCGKCPACVLRAKGFVEAGITDPVSP